MNFLRLILWTLVVVLFVFGATKAPTNVDSQLLSAILFGALYAAMPACLLALTYVKKIV